MREHHGKQANAIDPLAEIIRALGPRPEPPQAHRDQVFAAAHKAWQGKLRARRRIRWLAVAASLTALLITGAIVQVMTAGNSVPAATIAVARGTIEMRVDDGATWRQIDGTQNLAPDTHLRTGSDGRAALALAAGGSLRLDFGTEIVVGRTRYELVSGALYFDSNGRAAEAPIEIATRFGVVEDIGTQFEVVAAQEILRVRVRSGRVAITDRASDLDIAADGGSEIELTPGGVALEREFPAYDPAWAWAEALAIPPSTHSILSYLIWIARETGNHLEFDPRYVERIAETENLIGDPEGHTPMEVLDLIVATSDFSYETADDGTIVIHRNEIP